MTEILSRISKIPGGEESLTEFLLKTFPHVLIDRSGNSTAVFGNFNAAVMTIPRRIILSDQDHNDLPAAVASFISDKPVSDYIIVQGTAYIEYLTDDLVHLVDKIPAQNWMVRSWRAAHNSPQT